MTQTQLSADALRIKQYELTALLEVRSMFVAKQFVHDQEQDGRFEHGFNMNCALDQGESTGGHLCGTVGCIGGWMFFVMKRDRVHEMEDVHKAHHYVFSLRSRALGGLFFPNDDEQSEGFDIPDYDIISPDFALSAIDSFLAGKGPDWPSACLVRN